MFGLLRDIVIAWVFGASGMTDAFWLAFKIPNLFRRLFAEGSFVQAVVPVMTDYQQQTPKQLREFIARVLGALLTLLIPLTLLVGVSAPWVLRLIAPGFDATGWRFDLTCDLLRLTFPYLPLIAVTAFAGAILNSHHRFAASAATPILLNLSFIVAALFFAPYFSQPIMALGWGVILAGIVQCFFLLYFVGRLRLLSWPKWGFSHPGVKKTMGLMLPTLIGSSASQINLLIDSMIASLLPMGSISWLYYADRLVQLPLALIGVAVATVMLPQLSKDHAVAKTDVFAVKLRWGIRWICVLGLPAALGLIWLAKPVIMTLFHYGQFTLQDVVASSCALQALALGLPAFMLSKVLTTAFYARQDTKTPLKVALLSIVTNVILSLLLYGPLAHVGLALATSLSAWLGTLLLIYHLRTYLRVWPERHVGWFFFVLRCGLGLIAMGSILYLLEPSFGAWLLGSVWIRLVWLCFLIVLAILVYFAALYVQGLALA